MSAEVVSRLTQCYIYKRQFRLSICIPCCVSWSVAVNGVSPSTAGGVSPMTNYYCQKKCTDFLSCFCLLVHYAKMHGGIRRADVTNDINRAVMGYA